MPKEPSKKLPSKGGLECEVDPDGFTVFVNLKDTKTGQSVSIELHRSAAAALRALLARSDGDDDDTFAVILRGHMTFGDPSHAEPPPISA